MGIELEHVIKMKFITGFPTDISIALLKLPTLTIVLTINKSHELDIATVDKDLTAPVVTLHNPAEVH